MQVNSGLCVRSIPSLRKFFENSYTPSKPPTIRRFKFHKTERSCMNSGERTGQDLFRFSRGFGADRTIFRHMKELTRSRSCGNHHFDCRAIFEVYLSISRVLNNGAPFPKFFRELLIGMNNFCGKNIRGFLFGFGDDHAREVRLKNRKIQPQKIDESCESQLPGFQDYIEVPKIIKKLPLLRTHFEEDILTLFINDMVKIIQSPRLRT